MRIRLLIRDVAEQKGMSMTKLHQRSEVAYGTIRKIWRDPYTDITLITLGRIAQALGVDASQLIESVKESTSTDSSNLSNR